MKKVLVVVVAILMLGLGGLMPVPAQAQGRGQGFRPCPYRPYDCPLTGICKPMKISGKINRIFTETLAEDMYPGMALILETQDKGRIHVHLGPVWFLERQEFALQPGQEATIQGICVEEGKTTRLVAARLETGDHVLVLRDLEGRPVWEAWRRR